MHRLTWLGGLLALCAAVHTAQAQDVSSERERFRVVTVARGLENPWALAFLPDGRMLVTERPGRIRIVAKDGALSAPLTGVPTVRAAGQGGLLDVVLDREFAKNQTLYLSYSEPGDGGAGTAVASAKLGSAGLTEVKVIFRQVPKTSGANHFGSRIVQARDGNLFITVGERYQRDRAQELGVHYGKVVRIRPDGSVPPDNPFVGREGARPEIWSLGHRNVQASAFDNQGRLWTVEMGARGGDELNRIERGRNYGWPVITHGIDYSGAPIGEGKAKAGMEQPRYFWVPSIAPSGMAFYTGDAFPKWKGNLFVGSLKFSRLVRLELDGEKVTREERLLGEINARVRDVRIGPDGLVYVLTDEGNGRLLRLEPLR